MNKTVEQQVKEFYDNDGWVSHSGQSGEDRYFRYAKSNRGDYGEFVASQPARLLESSRGTLLIAGAGDLPPSHLRAASIFDKVICADISEKSIVICKEKLGSKGSYYNASILNLPIADNFVDAALCAHCLYHIDKDKQAQAVSELIRVIKPNGKVVIIYVNPRSPLMLAQRFLKFIRVNKILGKAKLYMHSFPLYWWKQFDSVGSVSIHANDCMSSNQARMIAPTASMKTKIWSLAYNIQRKNPTLSKKLWTYITIVIQKY